MYGCARNKCRVSRFVVWLWLVKWNMFSFLICEFHFLCNFEKKKKKKEWWRKLFLMLQTVHVHNSSKNFKKGVCLYVIYTKVETAKWSDWFYMSYIFELELIHFCFASFDGFWATFPNISHLDPKPHYNPWKVLMIHVMHVIPAVENEKICKPMVDHFHWNEFVQNTYPLNTWELSVYFCKGLHI